MLLDTFALDATPRKAPVYPFTLFHEQVFSDGVLQGYPREIRTLLDQPDLLKTQTAWSSPRDGLQLDWDVIRYRDVPAVDWVLGLGNTGERDTGLVEHVKPLDVVLPAAPDASVTVHYLRGGTFDPQHLEPYVWSLTPETPLSFGSGAGRSSHMHMPFFHLTTPDWTLVVAVGWSGCWEVGVTRRPDGSVQLVAGMPVTRFRLHPGESVRTPRILLLEGDGDADAVCADFRLLIHERYAAGREGAEIQPVSFCNTCFTRGGHWLNETTAENQISLIHAYADIGLDALLTDAGWFVGGWPDGAGNWTPRPDNYPDGMAPVGAAARERGMSYGLWFEPERVQRPTWVYLNHPEWLLSCGDPELNTFLLNFGLPEVQEYFFNIVREFLELPGFAVYRQDFNMDPLAYWRNHDAEDRRGMHEMHYVAGLYAYWDRLAQTFPDSLREECASGGLRIDLETVMRMHLHQKTDYWFDHEANQAALFSLSRYLPNHTLTEHLRDMDDYAFHSTLACSMGLGWIADAEDFDQERGREILAQYQEVRQLLNGAWYPLTPCSRAHDVWLAQQFHRRDSAEGLVLAFRRQDSPYTTASFPLREIDPDASYEVMNLCTRATERLEGLELQEGLEVHLALPRSSAALVYRKQG